MREAFTYMFKDNKFFDKAMAYFALVFIANLLMNYAQTLVPPCPRCAPPLPWYYWVCNILGTLLAIIPLGYLYTCVKALTEQKENYVLPNINLWKNFVKGFKYAVALLLLVIPVLIVISLFISLIAGLVKNTVAGIAIISTAAIFITLCFSVCYIGFNWIFANKDTFFAFYRFKKLFELISENRKHYIMSFLVICLVWIAGTVLEGVFGATAAFLSIGTLPGLLITGITSALIGTYTVFVICYLTAKSINSELVEKL